MGVWTPSAIRHQPNRIDLLETSKGAAAVEAASAYGLRLPLHPVPQAIIRHQSKRLGPYKGKPSWNFSGSLVEISEASLLQA